MMIYPMIMAAACAEAAQIPDPLQVASQLLAASLLSNCSPIVGLNLSAWEQPVALQLYKQYQNPDENIA